MVLIDAMYVNHGGGKILLDYLVNEVEKNNPDVFYLFDDRCSQSFKAIDNERKVFLKPSFYERYQFYKKNKSKFSKVLCFGNLPPNIKLDATVYTYFHNLIYLSIPKEYSLKDKIKFKLKIEIMRRIAKNTNFWLVQSDLIKDKLHQKFHFKKENIKNMPFYPPFDAVDVQLREKNTYFYVSNAKEYKNHTRLINVFCQFYDTYQLGKLILTVEEEYEATINLINEKQKLGYPIKNIGFVGRNELHKVYLSSEYLIYPSLTESFGLGLIESIACGCKVIGADLPYTYEVCEPSLVFDPQDDQSFLEAFEQSLKQDVKNSIPKIKNNIDHLLNILFGF